MGAESDENIGHKSMVEELMWKGTGSMAVTVQWLLLL